jgi:hypothetical protein
MSRTVSPTRQIRPQPTGANSAYLSQIDQDRPAPRQVIIRRSVVRTHPGPSGNPRICCVSGAPAGCQSESVRVRFRPGTPHGFPTRTSSRAANSPARSAPVAGSPATAPAPRAASPTSSTPTGCAARGSRASGPADPWAILIYNSTRSPSAGPETLQTLHSRATHPPTRRPRHHPGAAVSTLPVDPGQVARAPARGCAVAVAPSSRALP